MKRVLIFAVVLLIFTGSFYGSFANHKRKVAARSEQCEDDLFPKPNCCGRPKQLSKINQFIMGGTNSKINEFPWLALILPVHCGGTLINSRWVLSAAHCFQLPDSYKVILGALNCDEEYCERDAESFSVRQIFNHKSFQYQNFRNDISLLKLKKSVTFSDHIKPICLPLNAVAKANLIGKNAIVAGWGYSGNGDHSKTLKSALVPIWSFKKCSAVFETVREPNHMCAGGKKGIDACDHDSGGPLFMQLPNKRSDSPYYQIGIVSFGHRRCAKKGKPGVYEKVTTHIKWIQHTISKHQ